MTCLPTLSTVLTLAKGRHRLVGTTGLGLRVADLPLFTAAAYKGVADASLHHRDLGLLHVLLLQLGIGLALLRRHELLARHDDEGLGGDGAGHDVAAEVRVTLPLQVLKEGPDLLLVGLSLALVSLERRRLDRDGLDEHHILGLGGAVGEAVVEDADAVVANLRVGAVDVDLVGLELARQGVAFVRFLGAAKDEGTRSRRGGLAGGGGRASGDFQTLGLLFFLHTLAPFGDDVVGGFTDFLVHMASEFADHKAGFGGLRTLAIIC